MIYITPKGSKFEISDDIYYYPYSDLFNTYLIKGKGLEHLLYFWGRSHKDLVAIEAKELQKYNPNPLPRLQAESVAWHKWIKDNPEESVFYALTVREFVWLTFSPTQQATFLSIITALEKLDLISIIDYIRDIKGDEESGSSNKFRLIVGLKPGSLGIIKATLPHKSNSIHYGFPDSYRERKETPSLQICTSPDDSTIYKWDDNSRLADIDIDYREFGQGHLFSENSNILGKTGSYYHYDMFIDHYYTNIPGLIMQDNLDNS